MCIWIYFKLWVLDLVNRPLRSAPTGLAHLSYFELSRRTKFSVRDWRTWMYSRYVRFNRKVINLLG